MNGEPETVYNLLYRLGVTANYTGFFYTSYAVSLCTERPERLLLVTKWLYPEVARHYRTKWVSVERSIRTVSLIIWRENRPLLEQLARRPLERRPRNAQLLAILAAALNSRLGDTGDRKTPQPVRSHSRTGKAQDRIRPLEG